MKTSYKKLLPGVLALLLAFSLVMPASAAECGFSDVSADSPWYESVAYIAERGITVGTGEGRYSPDTPITTRQWAVMLCRAYGKTEALAGNAGEFGAACLAEAYRSGWLSAEAMMQSDILMISHDIEFCARYAHRCALFFDGGIVTEAPPREFFSGNSFYTTSANRMARGLLPEAVTPEDVIAACGGTLPPAPELPDEDFTLPQPAAETADWKPQPLSWWRKLIAAVSGAATVILLLQTLGISDLTALVSQEGVSALAGDQLRLYGVMLFCMLAFAFSISRRSHRPDYLVQTPKEKRKLSKRTLAATVLILLLIPLTLFIGEFYLAGKKYYFISLLILLECMIPFFLIFESRKPQARELVIIAVLCAIGVAGRAAFFMLPQFKPVMALTIIAGVAFGGETGFLVGAMTMLASNVLFSQGPWTPWQMFCMGIIGFLAGVLFRKGWLRRSRLSLCIFGALAAILIYGGIMNPASALMWTTELNWKILMTYYISGFPMDCIHAAATWIFLWFAAEPMLEKLDRIKVKYGLVE